jgi:hypothetical protein
VLLILKRLPDTETGLLWLYAKYEDLSLNGARVSPFNLVRVAFVFIKGDQRVSMWNVLQ